MALKRIAIWCAALLVLAAAGAFLVLRPAPRGGAEPNIDGLKGVLERSASNTLSAPEVTNEKLTVFAAKEGIARKTDEIIRMASDAGGTAMKSTTAEGDPEVLASIPASQAAKFIEAVTGKASQMLVPSVQGAKELIDVIITSSAISTPSP
jgi:hypothetical protein